MRCSSYAFAEALGYKQLNQSNALHGFQITVYDDVTYACIPESERIKDVFIFNYGCAIFWGFTEREEKEILQILKPFCKNYLPVPETELCNIKTGHTTTIHDEEDYVELNPQDPLDRLTLSHGFAQSVKLAELEDSIQSTLDRTQPIMDELAATGRSKLSRQQLSQMIGDLFVKRTSINLHCDILDTPEFFWRRPKYEPLYLKAAEYMDIGSRLAILNKRLDVIYEIYNLLSDEMKHNHSSFLEVVIILLITGEVVMAILKDILHWI